jgi:acyl-CoA synthetase (AMP-forming)/AMP-acid ligase II
MSNWQADSFWLTFFQKHADRTALIWHDQEYNYAYLVTEISNWIEKLDKIKAGAVVGLESDFSPQTIAILFALIEKNCILAPFDIHFTESNKTKYDIAQLDYLIQVNNETQIDIQSFPSEHSKHEFFTTIQERGNPGLLLFTSGSSGKPKGALHDFSKLLEKFKTERKSLRTVNFLLFDHWGGLNTLFHILSNGGTLVVLENRNPDYVCELIFKHKVELLPTSPTFLNMVLMSRAYERFPIDSLQIISYGAEPMPEGLLTNLNRLFPKIQFQQTYGLIELGVVRSKSESNGSLWVKIGGEGFSFRVVDGMLEIKAESAMLGYLNAPSPFTEDGWFMTGDKVEVKGEYFRILGRASELINVGGEKVYPQEVENVIMEVEGIEDVVVYGDENPLTGKIVCAKIFYTGLLSKKDIIAQVKTHCRTKLQSFKVPIKISVHDESFRSDRFKKKRV